MLLTVFQPFHSLFLAFFPHFQRKTARNLKICYRNARDSWCEKGKGCALHGEKTTDARPSGGMVWRDGVKDAFGGRKAVPNFVILA